MTRGRPVPLAAQPDGIHQCAWMTSGSQAAGDGADGGTKAREEGRDHDHAPGLVEETAMQVPGIGHAFPGVRAIAKAPDGDASGAFLFGQPGCMGHDGLDFISEIDATAREAGHKGSSRVSLASRIVVRCHQNTHRGGKLARPPQRIRSTHPDSLATATMLPSRSNATRRGNPPVATVLKHLPRGAINQDAPDRSQAANRPDLAVGRERQPEQVARSPMTPSVTIPCSQVDHLHHARLVGHVELGAVRRDDHILRHTAKR